MSKIVLPYEPNYVGGRETEKRRKQTQEWLRQRELEQRQRDRPRLCRPNTRRRTRR